MKITRLVLRSLQYRARVHAGVVLGAAVGSAALVGALAVGDSVRGTLTQRALDRIGKAEHLLTTQDRFVSSGTNTWTRAFGNGQAVVLHLPAVASTQKSDARANAVQVYGVGPDFWKFANGGIDTSPRNDEVLLNEALAAQLRIQIGDEIILRLHKPSALSRETPIAPSGDTAVALRAKVSGIVRPDQLGNFSRMASQVPPFNTFMALDTLQRVAGLSNQANLVLIGKQHELTTPEALDQRLQSCWQLVDTSLELVTLPDAGEVVLRSSRIFLDDATLKVTRRAATNNRPVLTYLANLFRAGTNTTPYSMISAAPSPWTDPDQAVDEAVVNEWLAEDLNLRAGDALEVTYFQLESAGNLIELTNRFRVRRIAPLRGIYSDRSLMPEFPGIAQAESTHEWDAGFPLVHPIRPKDEAYWKAHRGTPKAFVTPAAGQALWANRFGSATSVRYPVPSGVAPADHAAKIERTLLRELTPAMLGLQFEPARTLALQAATQAQDFGQLFLGFSFFLVVAALLLMALLFQFGLEQRATEVGTLLAIGYTPRTLRRMFWLEGALLALIGGILGAAGGLFYARALLEGLTTIWRNAVGTGALEFYVSPVSMLIGVLSAVIVSALVIRIVLRHQARQPARELLAEGSDSAADMPSRAPSRRSLYYSWISLALALGLVGWAGAAGGTQSSGIFFGAGTLMLVSGLGFMAVWLRRLSGQANEGVSTSGLAVRGATRRPKRSLAVAGLLACGSFLVVAIGAFKLDANTNAWRRDAGTGGFALIGETTLPVVRDLNTSAGRDFYALDPEALRGVSFVPIRVRSGDDASCLNLNRAQRPRVLGVQPELLAQRNAFRFARVMEDSKDPWLLLKARGAGSNAANRVIPAIGDAASIQWALGKKLGDTVDYLDERGEPFKLQIVGALANSILQGSLVVDDGAFRARFPGETGHRMFLVDAPSNSVESVAAALSQALADQGMEITPAVRRLAAYNAVQNTYLNTFQVLGGLGLLLGSAGLAVVVLRNVLERRAELAVLQTVGFRRRTLRRLVLGEHAALLWLGLGIGMTAALISILPALRSASGDEVPWRTLSLTVLAVLASGMLWTWAATAVALKGKLLSALRNE